MDACCRYKVFCTAVIYSHKLLETLSTRPNVIKMLTQPHNKLQWHRILKNFFYCPTVVIYECKILLQHWPQVSEGQRI